MDLGEEEDVKCSHPEIEKRQISLFVSPLWCHMKTSQSHSLTLDPMCNLHKGVMAHALLPFPNLSIRLSGFQVSMCCCHPSFFH